MKTILKPALIALSIGIAMFTRAQVPSLSSYPAAPAVIYLDFDGHTVTGTSWNYWNYNNPIVCGAATLNNTQITQIFNRVAEDYRPFNINVTTDSTKFLAAPIDQRMRIILTTTSAWYGAAGGVAIIGSFPSGDDTPCFVFSSLLNNNVKNVAEAASHEAGHTLGLFHQSSYDANCVKTSDYNQGIGSGEIGWAPVMGVGYYRNFTVWNNGPNPYGCTSYQNDLDLITSPLNGFGYRTDDHNNTFGAASLANFSSSQFNVNGIIERNTDQDLFRFIMPAPGQFQLEATPYSVGTGNAGSNLDMQVTLYNTSETALSVYNPGALLSSIIDTALDAGTYYLKVEGKGNQYAPAYASLGSYSLLASITGGSALPLRRLELRGSLNGDKHELNWTIEADESIASQVLEVSTDGRSFETLTESSSGARSYIYRPYNLQPAQYRLSVTFDNGRRHYSNVVTIRNNVTFSRPQLMSTLVQSNTIAVNSPGKYDYLILDVNGKMILKGQLVNGVNNIHIPGMINGMYLVRFADNTQQWTDKLLRQ